MVNDDQSSLFEIGYYQIEIKSKLINYGNHLFIKFVIVDYTLSLKVR